MLLKSLGLLIVSVLCCWGCAKTGDNKWIDKLTDEQAKHARRISQMSKEIDSVDQKLSNIEKSISNFVRSGSGTPSAKGQDLAVASDFASTAEYVKIIRQIGLLQEQLAMVQEEFVGVRDKQKEAKEQEVLRDREGAMRAISQPEELSRRLDILVKNFSGTIADPVTRDQFVSDVENMKAGYFTSLSQEEKRQTARAILSETSNAATNDRLKRMLERQLRSLDEPGNGSELEERVNRVLQFQRMQEITSLARRYDIPRDVVTNSGLIYWTAPHPPMSFSGSER